MHPERNYWLAAIQTSIAPKKFHQWLKNFNSMQSIYTANQAEWEANGISKHEMETLQNPDWQAVETALKWAEQSNHHILTLTDEAYPALLREISDPPLILFVQGEKNILSQMQIAIVGSRKVSVYGEKNAKTFAAQLAQAGCVITSGLALGVDAASHRGALSVNGLTIAVAGTGLQITYPAKHKPLADEILTKGGALISEFPLTAEPFPHHFPRRNRIISGLSRGVLVVEAALQSGSLVTARHAMEQGRDVFAIPGHIQNPQAQGCHALIRQGAKLVATPQDVLEELAPLYLSRPVEISPPLAIMPQSLTADGQKVFGQLRSTATPLDEIILRSGLTASEVSSILLILELQGHIQSVTGGYVR